MLHHVLLEVSDLERAAAFYDSMLAPLGWRRHFEEDNTVGWGIAKPVFFIAAHHEPQPGFGLLSFSALGIALTAVIPSQDAAAPIVNALLLPLYFLSGIFIPDDELPQGVINFANHFPIRDFFQAFFNAYLPGNGPALAWDHLAVVAIWGVAGLLLSIRFFRWTPRGG